MKTAGGIVLGSVAVSAVSTDVLPYISVAIKASFLKLGMCNICKNNIAITDRSVDQFAGVRLKLSLNKTRVQVVSFIASLSGCQFVPFAGGLVSFAS